MEYLPHILKTADILEQAGIKTGVKWDKKEPKKEDVSPTSRTQERPFSEKNIKHKW